MPPRRGVALKGRFQTLVGCNDCEGGALRYPSYLQSWVDDGTTLALEKNNVSVSFSGIPAAFTSDTGCHVPGWERSIPSHSCGIRTPAHVIRTADDALLVAMDAYAADGPTTCGKREHQWQTRIHGCGAVGMATPTIGHTPIPPGKH